MKPLPPATTLLIQPDGLLIPANGGQRLLRLVLRAPLLPRQGERNPLSLGLIIDRSGSMSGNKLGHACEAVLQALARLDERDRVAVLAYDTEVQVVQPAGPVDATCRQQTARALKLLRTGGSTDLGLGWLSGCTEADKGRGDRLGRCFLLTDGLTNAGIIDPVELSGHAAALRQRGMVTSTFGIGDDFDEAMLGAIAEAGGGGFYDIARGEGIIAAVQRELGEALEVVATGVGLHLRLPPGAQIEVLAPYAVSHGAAGPIVALPDLVSGQELSFSMLLTQAAVPVGTTLPLTLTAVSTTGTLAETTVTFTADEAGTCARQELDRQVLMAAAQAMSAQARRQATRSNQDGDFDFAARTIGTTTRALEMMADSAESPELAELASGLAKEQEVYGAPMNARTRKDRYFASTNTVMSRTVSGESVRVPPP